MAEALTGFCWWFILSISTPTMDRGRFSNHFLLSVDNMCLSFFNLWEFSEKMLTCPILSQKWRRPWHPILFCDLPSPFQRPQWTGVDFPATSFYPLATCVFPSLVSESFLKKYWRAQYYLKMAEALTRFFQRPQWTEVDFPATSFYPWTTCVFPSLAFQSFLKKCWRAQFYLKVAKAPTRFLLVIYPLHFHAHNGHGSIFQPLPSIRGQHVSFLL